MRCGGGTAQLTGFLRPRGLTGGPVMPSNLNSAEYSTIDCSDDKEEQLKMQNAMQYNT